MNTEFVYINDNNVAVSDKNGNITIRDAKEEMRDLLVAENKLEDLNITIDDLDENIRIENVSINLINKWYKMMGVLSLGIIVAAPITLGLASGFGLILTWGVAACASCGYGAYNKFDSLRRINGYCEERKKAESLKDEIKKYLEDNELNKQQYNVDDNMIGEVVKVNSSKAFEEQDQKLNTAFHAGYKDKSKVLAKNIRKSFY